MNRKKNIALVLLPLLMCLGIVGGVFIGRYITRRTLSAEEEKLRTILGIIKTDYVDRIDVDSLIEQSLPDLLASLDPHSAYIPRFSTTRSTCLRLSPEARPRKWVSSRATA